jgi:protein SCO1/2
MMKRRTQSTNANRDRAALGVLTPTSAAIFMVTGVGLYVYFKWEKQKQAEARETAREARSFGRPAIGGPFELFVAPSSPSDANKSKLSQSQQSLTSFSEKDLQGKWTLLYFGFTNCPDICPAEMDKMGDVLDATEPSLGPIIQPVFVTVDPARDTPSQIATYLQDFHPKFIGLHGSHEKIKAACKSYRVYFSTPPDADPNGDYLVDHSIFIYLLDPKGDFVEVCVLDGLAGVPR